MDRHRFGAAGDERKQARILTRQEVDRAFEAAKATDFPLQNTLMLALSFWAGLRACEMAKLDTIDQLDVEGRLTGMLHVSRHVAKYGRERTIPMRPRLMDMMQHFLSVSRRTDGPILRDRHGDPISSDAVRLRFQDIFRRAGLGGASSHSGRRTLITLLCRNMWRTGCTIQEVQAVAGHQSPDVTMRYIQPSDQHDELLAKLAKQHARYSVL